MARQSRPTPLTEIRPRSLWSMAAASVITAVIILGSLVAVNAHALAPMWGNDPSKPRKPPKVEIVITKDGQPRWIGPLEVRERLARCYPTCRSHKG